MAKKNFDKLPIAEQRVVIAKDLIARLNAKRFIAKPMTYIRAKIDTSNGEVQLRDAIGARPCRGCQIGGMFLCAVDRHNDLKLNDVDISLRHDGTQSVDVDDMRRYLGRWFSDETLQDVEAAFECDVDSHGRDFWVIAHIAAEDRMRLIAKNIIKNKGRFVPAQLLKLAA